MCDLKRRPSSRTGIDVLQHRIELFETFSLFFNLMHVIFECFSSEMTLF